MASNAGEFRLDEPRLFMAQRMASPLAVAFAGGIAVVFSTPSPAKSTGNEDSAGLIPTAENCGVIAVADGLGGRSGGARASAAAIRCLQDSLGGQRRGLREAVLDGFENADREISAFGIGAATTVAAVTVVGTTVRPYHAGDSMVLVVGSQGKLKLRTLSHAPVSYAMESGLIDELRALRHPERHLVSNVVGGGDMRIEIGAPLELAPRDTVLLATDGLFDNFECGEIADLVRSGPLDEVAGNLASLSAERMSLRESGGLSKPDDLTFVLFRAGPKAATEQ